MITLNITALICYCSNFDFSNKLENNKKINHFASDHPKLIFT